MAEWLPVHTICCVAGAVNALAWTGCVGFIGRMAGSPANVASLSAVFLGVAALTTGCLMLLRGERNGG